MMDNNSVSATAGNDLWGWFDESSGNEYALMGLDYGTAFVDITKSRGPSLLRVLAHTNNNVLLARHQGL